MTADAPVTEPSRADELAGMSPEDRAVAARLADLPDIPLPDGAEERAVQRAAAAGLFSGAVAAADVRRASARRVAAYIRQETGFAAPRLPSFAELVDLATDYQELAGNGHDEQRERLCEAGQIYVTPAAARLYGAELGIADEEAARRELTELLHDARQIDADPARGRSRWRRRPAGGGRRATAKPDVIARVRHDGRLLVVVAVEVDPHSTPQPDAAPDPEAPDA